MRFLSLVLAAALGGVLPLAAQPAPAAAPATLDGWTFPVPEGYQPVPVAAPGDASLALFRHPRTRAVVFVATVPAGEHRAEALARARTQAAGAVLGGEPGAVDWRSIPSFAVSRDEIYHDARLAPVRGGLAAVQLRLLRVGGRDVATGYAFPIPRDEESRVLAFPFFYDPDRAAAEASAAVVGALAGGGPVADASLAPMPVRSEGAAADPEEAAVLAARAALEAATRAKDAAAVAGLVARPYLEFLEDMKHLALHAPMERVRAEPLMNQLYVLDLRHRVAPAELRAMDARALLAHAWNTGWLGTGGYDGGDGARPRPERVVVVAGDAAFVRPAPNGRGRQREGGSPVSRSTQEAFRREDGAWKVDALPAIPLLEPVLRQRIESLDGAPERAVLVLLQQLSGKLLESNVWNPPPAP